MRTKRARFKRALSFTLAVSMAASLTAFSASKAFAQAAPVAQILDSGYDTLQDAVNAAAEGQTVQLCGEVNLAAGIAIEGKSIVLDLNGQTVNFSGSSGNEEQHSTWSGAIEVGSGAGITIADGAGGGKIVATASESRALTVKGGTATISGGTLEQQNSGSSVMIVGIYDDGVLNVSGGIITGGMETNAVYSDGTINLTGGAIINHTNNAIWNDKTVNIEDGTVEITSDAGQTIASWNGGGTVVFNGGTAALTAGADYGISSGNVQINGGEVTITAATQALQFQPVLTDTMCALSGDWNQPTVTYGPKEQTPPPSNSASGGGSGSGNGPAAAPAQRIVNMPTATKTSAANNIQTYRNYDLLTPDGAKTIASKSMEVNFDKTVGNKVLSRITMNPADLAKAVTKNVKLGVHFDAKDKEVSAVASKLGNYFSNKMVLVTYDQKNVLPVNAEFAARLDLSGLNTKALYFYSYDSTTNKYTQISAPNYFVDANGYIHFTAPFGGTVIITDAPLAK